MKRMLFVILFCIASFAHADKKRVLIIGVDGFKGTVQDKAVFHHGSMPTLRKLMSHGRFTRCHKAKDHHCARAHDGYRYGHDYEWVTAPGWASVITGVNTNKHRIKGNSHDKQKVFYHTSQSYPSIFMRAKKEGLKTAASGVGCFLSSLSGHKTNFGITDYECGYTSHAPIIKATDTKSCNLDSRKAQVSSDDNRDQHLSEWLVKQVNGDKDIVMGVFDQIDAAGGKGGFGENQTYHRAIRKLDGQIKPILETVHQRVKQFDESWLILLTADHGGHDKSHGKQKDDDDAVPFVIAIDSNHYKLAKPIGLKKGMIKERGVRHMDVAASAMYWLGISFDNMDGKVRSDYIIKN